MSSRGGRIARVATLRYISGLVYGLFWTVVSMWVIDRTFGWPTRYLYLGPWDYQVHPQFPQDSWFIPGRIVSVSMLILSGIYLVLLTLIHLFPGNKSTSVESREFALSLKTFSLFAILSLFSCSASMWLFGTYTD